MKSSWFNLAVSGLCLLLAGIVFVTCDNSLLNDIREATATARDSEVAYQITFDANGGHGTMSKQSVRHGQTVTLNPNAFARTGYGFEGWATEADGEVVYSNSAEYTHSVQQDINLYARWEAGKYSILFDSNGGSGWMADQPVEYEQTVTLSANNGGITRAGFTFVGWATTIVGPVVYSDASEYTHEIQNDRTLYAKWTPNQYIVTFNPNDGTTPPWETKEVTHCSTYGTLPTPARMGYTFAGWYTDSTDGTLITASTTFNLTTNQMLYAQWTPNEYQIIFHRNGGSGTMDNQDVRFGETVRLAANRFTFTGYTISHWAVGPLPSGVTYENEAMYTHEIEGNIELYAIWMSWQIGMVGPGGGIVFYGKPSYSDGWRYMEAWIEDQPGTFQWKTSTTSLPENGTAIGSGYANTAEMTGTQYPAAYAVRNATHGGKNDWFLPSKDELNELYVQRNSLGLHFVNAFYWSSSRSGWDSAWGQNFGWSGSHHQYGSVVTNTGYVRAVRRF